MVKTPRTRHSKPQRAPVTIELTANKAAATSSEASEVPAQEPVPSASDEQIIVAEPIRSTKDEPVPATDEHSYDRSVEDRIVEEEDLTGRQHAYDAGRQAEPANVPPPTARGGNWASRLAAGLIGGLLAAGAGWLLQPGLNQDTTAIDGVRSEVAGIKAEIDALKAGNGGNADLAGAVEQLRGEFSTLQSAVQAAGGDTVAVTALKEKIAQIEASIASLSASDGQGVEQRIAAIEQSVAGLTSKLDSQTAQPKIALAIAAAALKSALERGVPFNAELETFAAIAPNLPQIEPLRALAQTGVTSRADIAKAFPDAANAMVAAANPVPEDAGFFQRLLSSAESVVQVRPIGEVAGEEPAARVARMEVAVNAGDYGKALAEYDALPDAAKAAGVTIAGQIKARADAEKLVEQLIAEAMKAA